MDLRELAGEGDPPVAKRVEQVAQRGGELVRRFVKHHGALFAAQLLEVVAAALLVHAQEALEREAARGQAGECERGGHGGRPRHGQHADAAGGALGHEILARIGDGGHSRVGDEHAVLSRLDPLADHGAAPALVVLIIAEHRLFQAEMVQQLQRDARVLRGDEIGGGERLPGTGGEIPQVSDRRSHHGERSAHVVRPPLRCRACFCRRPSG